MSMAPSSAARASTALLSRTSSKRVLIDGFAAPIPWPPAVMSAVFPWRRPVVTGGVGSLSFELGEIGRVRVVVMAGLARGEIATSTLGGGRSIQLSYSPGVIPGELHREIGFYRALSRESIERRGRA